MSDCTCPLCEPKRYVSGDWQLAAEPLPQGVALALAHPVHHANGQSYYVVRQPTQTRRDGAGE